MHDRACMIGGAIMGGAADYACHMRVWPPQISVSIPTITMPLSLPIPPNP